MGDYHVETGVPLPGFKGELKCRYPFPIMDVGDSFAFSEKEWAKVRNAAYMYSCRHPEVKFSVSKRGLRCWRVK